MFLKRSKIIKIKIWEPDFLNQTWVNINSLAIYLMGIVNPDSVVFPKELEECSYNNGRVFFINIYI